MGRVKEMLLEIEGRGYGTSSDAICANCIGEPFLAQYITENATNAKCSFCAGRRSVPLEEVMEIIASGLSTEYDDPVNGVGWCSAEGGWLGVEGRIWDTTDLLWQYFCCDETVMDALVSLLSQDTWVFRNPYGAREHEELLYTWQAFADIVKYKSRFVFFRANNIEENCSNYAIDPIDILDELGVIVNANELVKELTTGTEVVRARCSSRTAFSTPEELGPPPASKAVSSRMSPAGIPMFYCATDKETSIAETLTWKKATVTTVAWKTAKDLKIIDLSNQISSPSIFDANARSNRLQLLFLRNFVIDFCKPIQKDEREHIDYVPTQVVTEYFRRIFKATDGQSVDGIMYKSSTGNGYCYVFFADKNDFCFNGNKDSTPMFEMVPSSIESFQHTK